MSSLLKLSSMTITVCVLLLLTSCSGESIKGAGAAKQEERIVNPFTGIEINGKYAILGTKGKPEELVISTNPNLLSYIKSSVSNDILTIKDDDSVRLQPTIPQTIWFTADDLKVLRLNGDTQFQMVNLNGDTLDVTLKGSHKIVLKGKYNSVKMQISGSANVNGKDLQVNDADIEINGSGLVTINASENLKVKINGDGKVIYNGKPKLEQSISGAGKVSNAFGAL